MAPSTRAAERRPCILYDKPSRLPSWLPSRGSPVPRALGINDEQRCAAYREFVAEVSAESELDDIRLHLQCQHAFGPNRFRDAIEAQLGRRAGPAKIGRPAKPKPSAGVRESVL